jgi:YidC/Oxa1 family membrane protein insertase
MDRNTIIGLLLIFLLIIGYSYFTKPSEEEIQEQRRIRDSLVEVQQKQAIEQKLLEDESINNKNVIKADVETDAAEVESYKNQFGSFGEAAVGENEFYLLENELLKIKIATLGGRIYSVELKDFQTYDSLPLILFDGDTTVFGLNFFAQNRVINTNSLFFVADREEKTILADKTSQSISFKLFAGENKYIEYIYTMNPNSYMIDFDMNFVGMNEIIDQRAGYLTLNWETMIPGQEKGKVWETQNSGIYYKYYQDEVDNLTERSDEDDEDIRTRVKWIAFKQQFFSSILIADESFTNAIVKSKAIDNSSRYIESYFAEISIPYSSKPSETFALNYFFGPNHYNSLKKYSELDENEYLELERIVPLGWGFFLMHWINRFAVIPVFNYLERYIGNYGLIILVLTILLKLILFPFTYKSYQSTGKMRVLKPQIDEINKKIPKEKTMERQKATMDLYKKVGVNPAGGCLPMVLQFPILIAMFRFFPASIELRQKSFLWAEDLSAYDSILDLPFTIPAYGDHISLFCLLMAITNVVYTVMNNKMNPAQTQQMPGMKTMMYFMPVMFLVWFNNYSSGLSYYYFISTLITIGQTLLIRHFVDDEAILKKLETAKKKPVKKSKWQARIEDMQKKQTKKK